MSHPLEIPEIVRIVGRYVEKSSEIAAMKVSGAFHSQVSATAWETIVVDFTNKGLYRELPSEVDMYDDVPRLLPWKSLESYGSHVRTIIMASVYDPRPPRSYPRPASVADLFTTLGELPSLKSMTLSITSVDTTVLPQIFDFCRRLKSLDIRSCEMSIQGTGDISNRNRKSEASAHKSDYEFLEELSISSNSGIGLWGFLSRSPRLRVLSIYDKRHCSYFEEQIMNDLVKSFRTEDILPSLQHLDLCIYRAKNDTISKVLKSVRCLRRFQCHRPDALLSISDFRPHFSTVTTIKVQSGKPEFWQKVMSSCPALVKAKEVVLFAEDIIGGKMWACTGLESLNLHVFVRSRGNVTSNRKAQEDALFQRIAKLVKLNHLLVNTGWREERTLHGQSWGILLGMKTLKSVILGTELTAYRDMPNVKRRFSEKQVDLTWNDSNTSRLSDEVVERDPGEARILQALQALVDQQAAVQN